MDTIFMNSGKSKTYDPHRLLLNLSNETKETIHGKNIKKSYKNNKFKTSGPT